MIPETNVDITQRVRLFIDFRLLSLVYTAATESKEFAEFTDLIEVIIKFWNSEEMRRRYMIRDGYDQLPYDQKPLSPNAEFFKVPELLVKVFIEYTK